VNNLTKQQEYLLQRIPKIYDIRAHNHTVVESAEVVKARKLIEAHETYLNKKVKALEVRATKAINEAREAVYFKSPQDALKIIKALEAEFGIAK